MLGLMTRFAAIFVVVLSIGLSGCREAPPQFQANGVRALSLERSRSVPTEAAAADVSAVVSQLFGTPGSPKWPAGLLADDDQRQLVSPDRLAQAAGGVTSDEANLHTGLYQEHCVICHAVSGSGNGPASRFQVPYPRDFRVGIFKWKSTRRSSKPTRDDLTQILKNGIPGSPMPSFAIVRPSEIDALVDYVIYLSVRGEVERELLGRAVDELDYDTGPPEEELRLTLVSTGDGDAVREGSETGDDAGADSDGADAELTEGQAMVVEVLQDVVDSWVNVEPSLVPPRPQDTDLAASIGRGKEIYHGQVANCVGCHGTDGAGGLPSLDYDDWTKDFTTRIGVSPDDKAAVKPFRKAGALPPRAIDPRVLAGGVIHGGSDPETIYRRIHEGIAGTPMPSMDIDENANAGTGLTPDQAWDLVNYVESIIKP
ncbi:Cytochrome C oxidase, cbb3-type, subunit III [Neorhodopirellula lusitana]|uniref:Cytochrome C oxidase, cbb3-type, subunit III n=2 Tax=Neorhodopirellula lusitana TaxID=445327 RepID=A0ABY1QB97_9BACT|nr:Cytochrome C oxidase, cbb3-type, subunit III [Neorhodopirellula lusitana]